MLWSLFLAEKNLCTSVSRWSADDGEEKKFGPQRHRDTEEKVKGRSKTLDATRQFVSSSYFSAKKPLCLCVSVVN